MAEVGGGSGGGDGEALDGAAVGEGVEVWTICCFHLDGGRKERRVVIKLILDQWTWLVWMLILEL